MGDKTVVVNIRNTAYDVFIGRGSKWGNPYKMFTENDRDFVIQQYRDYIKMQIAGDHVFFDIEELRGKRLGCYCKPKACHGDILVELLEETQDR